MNYGADTIDSSYPLLLAAQHKLLTRSGVLDLSDESLQNNHEIIETDAVANDDMKLHPVTYAYLHHLCKAFEPLLPLICAHRNLTFVDNYIRRLRKDIQAKLI